ncbi:MAG: PBP1A family penicillin-binding protein [Patescibacteria group bacterium]
MPIKQLLAKRSDRDNTPQAKAARKKKLKSLLLVGLVVLGALLVVGAFALTIALAWISRDLPDPNTLINRNVAQTTKIYDRTGTHLLYAIHGDENRTLIQISDLPKYIPEATVAIEDKNFYNEHGVDWLGLVRAAVTSVLKGQRIQGTSTLTQQLVKNAILTNERTLTRKVKEILLSLQMERVFTKDQILQLYLNEIPYGSTTYGIESAAQTYFGKSAKELTLDEAALLAALPQAPDLYSPYGTGSHGDNRDALVARQHTILDYMAAQGYITKQQATDAKNVDTLKKLVPQTQGDIHAPHFVMYVKSQLVDKYGEDVVETGGLNVITTLDWDKQQDAEKAVTDGVAALGKKYNFTNSALVSIDPKNGQILAMVGSVNFFDTAHDGQVNVALSSRQPGSSFKPIVYAASFIKGYTPDTTLWDVNTTFKTDLQDYSPKDYDLKERGPVTVRQALQGSLNVPAVEMLYLVGVGRVLDFAEQLGYTTFSDRSRFGLSLVLGGGEVKLLEHTNAYAAFADQGMQFPTAAIMQVTDPSGKVLQQWTQPQGTQVMDTDTANRISNILSDNNARAYVFGLHSAMTLPGRAVAAKTGTTNDFHDAWTLGYTPSLVAGVWVGNNDNSALTRGADGSVVAAPIWQSYMKSALASSTPETFVKPPPENVTKPVLEGTDTQVQMNVDSVTGLLATPLTPPEDVIQKTFKVAHTTLYYVDKDDPRGPQPTDPTQDPQFNNWESAVQSWVQRTGWNATSSPPTQSDDVHTQANAPVVTIQNPQANAQLSSRSASVSVNVTAALMITHVDVSSEGQLLGTSQSAPWNISINFPNSIAKGFHDITVTAYDNVGNQGSATVTVNLNADPSPISLHITSLSNGTALIANDFPLPVSVFVNDIAKAQKVDLYLQGPDGSTHILGTQVAPTSNQISFTWNYNPGPGDYTVFPVLTETDNTTYPGDSLKVTIGQ